LNEKKGINVKGCFFLRFHYWTWSF